MKRLITIYFLFLYFSVTPVFSQISIEGSQDFGRIFDLTYDAAVANKVYALTLGNHIVVSENNGATWEILYTLPIGESASIEQLKLTPDGAGLSFAVYTPNNSNSAVVLYDILSAQVVKTFALPNQNVDAYVSSYDFYNEDVNILLLDTNYGIGIPLGKTFYTTDGGINWNEIYFTENYDTVFINNVVISPNDPNKLFLTRGNGRLGVQGGLFVSEDAGQNWEEKLPNIILGPLAFDPSNDNIILLGTGISFGSTVENLYKSTDGGSTFEVVPINWNGGILNCINVIRYNTSNPAQIIILEENEIVVSKDAGSTWQNFVYLEDNPESYYYGLNASFNPYNSQEIFISGNYFPLFSEDGGETLTWTKTPYFSSTGNMDLYRDGTANNLYYGVQYGYLHLDLNSGIDTSYEILPLNYSTNNSGITQYADQITPNRLYTFTSSFIGSFLKVSDDNGATTSDLTNVFLNNFTAVATFPGFPETILAAFGGFSSSDTVLKKIDFSDINNVIESDITLPIIDYIKGALIDDAGKIILSLGVEIYSSTDGGTTWTNNSNGLEPMNPASDLIFDLQRDPLNEDRLAVASSKGVFISNDGGQNWEQKSTNSVFQIGFSTETEGAIVASTYSSLFTVFALHYSTDNGDTWQTISNEQLLHIGSRSSAYLFSENSVKVFVGSYDLGLMAYTIDLSTAGTPDYIKADEIRVYPNPAKSVINIELSDAKISEAVLYNLTGQQVLKLEGVGVINVSQLNAGIYLLRVLTSTDKKFFKRIVIK